MLTLSTYPGSMYTGRVSVGGPADVHELTHLSVSKIAVGPMDNNSYLLRCRETGKQLLIDAAAEPERLLDLIGTSGLSGIVTTHRHGDHWGALAVVAGATGATTYAGRDDQHEIAVPTANPLGDGDVIDVGRISLRILHVPGHTPGSVCVLYDDPDGAPHLFTGDALFPGGVGKTWSPTDFLTLITAVENRIFATLPDTTWVYPGHGADTTLGAERPHLTEWRERGW